MIDPLGMSGPPPHPDTPESPLADYEEARSIAGLSPRGACALLRLALQKLCTSLGASGDLNSAIGELVSNGLDPQVQRALDTLRVVGNNAVHPGEMDLADDHATANALFGTMNFIVEQLITRPRVLSELYTSLPERALAQIERRDAPADNSEG
jgi:hypothetical protein